MNFFRRHSDELCSLNLYLLCELWPYATLARCTICMHAVFEHAAEAYNAFVVQVICTGNEICMCACT
jgi:hypothetical protein